MKIEHSVNTSWIDPYTIKVGTKVGPISCPDRMRDIQNKLRRRQLTLRNGLIVNIENQPR